jgi:hypothetical protein
MTSHFRINVAKRIGDETAENPFGQRWQHMFATAEHSLRDKHEAYPMLELMRQKFPETEGYKVDMVYLECRWHTCP